MAASLLQAGAVVGACLASEGGDEDDNWDHTKCVRRNLPKPLISEVENLPEVLPQGGARCAKLIPCLGTQLPHGIWYREQPTWKALPRQPKDANEYLYARLVTLATYHRVLGVSSVRSIFSVIGHYSLLNMACEVATSKEYADVAPSIRAAFVGCVALPVVVWGLMCGRDACRELQSHQTTGDYTVHEGMEHFKDLANIFIFQLLAIPRSVKDAPIMYHTRKPTQPFCAIKLRNRRMWILGYMCEEQSVFEEEQGQENQLPLYLCHIPVFVLQGYIALCLGAWSASSVLTIVVSSIFLVMNLVNVASLKHKKRVYQDVMQETAKAIEKKILKNSYQVNDLDRLGTLDKLFGRDFGQRCSSDPQVLNVLDDYTDKNFRGQKNVAPIPEEEGDEEEDEEECSPFIRGAACGLANKAASRDDEGSRGSSRSISRGSERAR